MHDKRNKDKGWREFPSSGEKRSGRKGGLSAWPVKVIQDFSFRNSRRGNGLFNGAPTGFFTFSGAAFRQLGAGQEAGRYGPERRISRTGRPGVSVSGFWIFPRFRRSGQAGGPAPWPAGFQYRLPRKGQVNRGLEGWEARPLGLRGRFLSRPFPPTPPKAGEPGAGGEGWAGPSAPLPQGPSGQRNPVARLAGTARFLVHRRTPNGPVKMQKNLGR